MLRTGKVIKSLFSKYAEKVLEKLVSRFITGCERIWFFSMEFILIAEIRKA